MSGRRTVTTGVAETMEMLRDVHKFDPAAGCWRLLADMPAARMAVAAVAVSLTRVAVLAGDDGRLAAQTASPKDDHPGFSRTCLMYDADDDAWTTADETPTCQLATTLAPWEGGCVMGSGEIRQREIQHLSRKPGLVRSSRRADPIDGRSPCAATRGGFRSRRNSGTT